MTNPENLSGASNTYVLEFQSGDKLVTQKEVERFCEAVDKNASTVCQGIVELLQKGGIPTRFTHSTNRWSILVGSAASESAVAESHTAAEAPVPPPTGTTNITVTVNSAHLTPTINALNAFFGSWRTVAGLTATLATVVGSAVILLRVYRQP